MRALVGSILVLGGFVVACGGEPPVDEPPGTPGLPAMVQPKLREIGPSGIAAGQTLFVMGQDFADPAAGVTRLMFEGVYQSTSGKTNPVRIEVVPRFVNQGLLEWTFGPNIPFTTDEDTGHFRGVIKAVNVGRDGNVQHAPQALGAELQVLPSILVRQMRPLRAACGVGITDTTEETDFLFELKAVGLKSGTQMAPLRFVYSFMRQHFNFRGYFSNQLAVDPEALFPKEGPISVLDEVTNGTVSTLGTGTPRQVAVAKGGVTDNLAQVLTGGLEKTFGLVTLQSAAIGDPSADSVNAAVTVVAVDSSGLEARRVIPLRIWTPIEVDYGGQTDVVRSFDPVPVSACLMGGDIGRDATYSEQVSETRSRGYNFIGKASGGFDIKIARLNAEFGIEVKGEVTSAKATNLQMAGRILPARAGVFYRQTLQLERRAKLTAHGPCGNTQALGEVVVTDWAWSPDLAVGAPPCPPLPRSNLKSGQVFKPVQ